MTLTDFLLARLAEDEAVAHEARGGLAAMGARSVNVTGTVVYIPDRALADVAAKRAIVEVHTRGVVASTGEPAQWCEGCGGEYAENGMAFPCPTLGALAQPYADHPGFDPAWRVEMPWGDHDAR